VFPTMEMKKQELSGKAPFESCNARKFIIFIF